MGGRQHSYVNGNWPVTADAFDLTFLQHSQQCDLDFRGQVAYFVQENRPAIRRFKTAQAPLRRTGEGALLMTKELGSNQRCGDCGAIHTNKCPFPAVGSLVDGARDQLLSCAGFAQNQDGGIRTCHFADLAEHFTQCFGGADYVLKHRVTIDLLSQREVFVAHPLFRLLAIFDVSRRREPETSDTAHLCRACAFRSQTALHLLSRSVVRSVLFRDRLDEGPSYVAHHFPRLASLQGYVRYSRASSGSPEVEIPQCPGPARAEEGNL